MRRDKTPVMQECDKDTVIQMIEQNEVSTGENRWRVYQHETTLKENGWCNEYMRDSCDDFGVDPGTRQR